MVLWELQLWLSANHFGLALLTWTPAELIYMKMGRVGLSYWRYSSSASNSSVTAGTSDIPCGQYNHIVTALHGTAGLCLATTAAATMWNGAHQIYNALLEEV